MSQRKRAILFLILANIIWGAAFPLYKWSLEIIPPFSFAFIRFFIAALIIFPFTFKHLKVPLKDLPPLILASIISITFQIILLFYGLKLSPSINAPVIFSAGPIILIIASAIFLKDLVKTKVLVGTIISLTGVLILILRPYFINGVQTQIVLGNTLLFLSMLCNVGQTIILKKILSNNRPMTLVFWTFVIGAFPFIIPAVLFEPKFFQLGTYLNFQVATGLIYAAIFSSVLAYFLFYYGLKYIKASEIGIFSYVDPIATILVAIPLLSEKITSSYILSAFMVFFGIFIAEKRIHYHPVWKLFKKEDTT
jgi:drug/metabolite transporter (DMT)-like permease